MVTVQGGLVGAIQFQRAESAMGTLHHSIRPESTAAALKDKDDVSVHDRPYLLGRRATKKMAPKESKRRAKRDDKRPKRLLTTKRSFLT